MNHDVRPPNILLLISDEHAPQAMGCMGADYAITPHLDRLAENGVVFDNAYCNYPICTPSRASLMAGRLPHNIEAWDNGAPLSSAYPSWAHMLHAQGYDVPLSGKMHLVGPDWSHGFSDHWLETAYPIWGWRWGDEQPGPSGYRAWANVHIRPDEEFHPTAIPRDIPPMECAKLPGMVYHTIDVDRQREAVNYLRQAASSPQPFCLTVGYIFPHYPQICTQSAYDRYEGVDIPAPIPPDGLHPRHRRWREEVWNFHKMTDEETVRARRVYLAMITMMDAWIGELMETLEQTGLAENTVVIYTSDHGDMMGEHGMWGKSVFFEHSARVPMIVSAPSLGVRQGARVDTPVSLLDLYPTLRDIADAEQWQVPLDGRSLWAACTAGEALDDIPIFAENYGTDIKGPERMVRYKQYKLNYYYQQPPELFDLERDPQELTNLADDPAYAEVREQLLAMLLDGWDPDELSQRVRESQHLRALLRTTPFY